MKVADCARPILSTRLPTLDGWRAIAIGLVIWHHAALSTYSNEALYYRVSYSRLGSFGVDIFFGLSGLLITTLLLEEREQTGMISLRGFYLRRVFRILPPALFFVLVIASLGLVRLPLELTSCAFFFRNYLPIHLGGWYTGTCGRWRWRSTFTCCGRCCWSG